LAAASFTEYINTSHRRLYTDIGIVSSVGVLISADAIIGQNGYGVYEMARTLDTTTRQLQRIVALRYNPYFEQEVQKIRHKYKIPQDSEQARDWFKSLLKRYPRNTLTFYFKLWFRGKQHL